MKLRLIRTIRILGLGQQHVPSDVILVGRLEVPGEGCVHVGHDRRLEEIFVEGVVTEGVCQNGSVVDVQLWRPQRIIGSVIDELLAI